MNSYKLEDIEELATRNNMRVVKQDGLEQDAFIFVYLDEYRVSTFRRIFTGIPQYNLLSTYTNVINGNRGSNFGNIYVTEFVIGSRFFGNLNDVYENMYKKYKEILKTIKAADIKNCGTEFEI
jgi:hypothetical protein